VTPQLELFAAPATEPAAYPDGVPPAACDLFERLTLDVALQGFDRYSARAILQKMRWHERVDGESMGYKCNDHWTAPLARWFLANHPELPKFFELREREAAHG
jgi:hypothetical protein